MVKSMAQRSRSPQLETEAYRIFKMNNRSRRNIAPKPFVSGGVYNPNTSHQLVSMPVAPVAVQPQVTEAVPQPIPVKEEVNVPKTLHDDIADIINDEENTSGKIPFKKIFQKRKKSSERTRDKKLRQNRQLRKSMLPKNALMALNEVKGINISDFTINNNPDGGFTAIVTVNTTQYEGKGISKMAAKNLACEKALRDYIIAKMTPKLRKKKPISEEAETADDMDTSDNDDPKDDLPMINLASFAIYKLFAEWEREGYMVPEMHPSNNNSSNQSNEPNAAVVSPASKEPKKPPMRSELPPNWETMHPATLLCVMRPGLSYIDHGTIGEKPNIMMRLGVIVDNQEFTANGRSKKIARRNVAVNVCNTLFNTNFPYEEY